MKTLLANWTLQLMNDEVDCAKLSSLVLLSGIGFVHVETPRMVMDRLKRKFDLIYENRGE